MAVQIYIDAITGSDSNGDGSLTNPYKTLQYFCNSVAIKTNADYKIILQNGTYEITNEAIFGQFVSGSMEIIGKGEKTEIVQRTSMYNVSGGGSISFNLIISKLKYSILETLTATNLITFKWNWSFYNVLFEKTPNNDYSVFLPLSGNTLNMRNCVKLTNTTNFFRATHGIISVVDSIGYFTSGYGTTQSQWDKGGNTIGSIANYEGVLKSGIYYWVTNKILLSSGVDNVLSLTADKIINLPDQSEQTFINYGAEEVITSNILNGVTDVVTQNQVLGEGKTFTHTIDLDKWRGKRIML